MVLKSLFNKDARRERALQKARAKATNKKLKPDDRRPALELLVSDGGDEAVAALLGRLSFNYDTNMVADEDEKNYVYQGLLSLGERVLPALRQHMHRSPSLSWHLRLISELCDKETTWNVVSEALGDFEPGYDRDPTKKLQLLTFVGDFDDERAGPALLPFLEDHDEGVRFATTEGLFARKFEEAREPLLQRLVDEDEESLRLKNRICQGFVETGWTVKGFRGTVEKYLADAGEYVVDGKGHIKPKKRKGQ